MKKSICIVLVILSVLSLFACSDKSINSQYLRIHIRADNNEPESQSVKYAVKEKVVNYLTPLLSECRTKQEALKKVESRLPEIESLCDGALRDKGFSYGSRAGICNEYFPLRSYGEFVFEDGYYDSLIINLGEGKGDNWWCMVYPPLCFTGGENDGSGDIKYKSRILEIIEEFREKYLK